MLGLQLGNKDVENEPPTLKRGEKLEEQKQMLVAPRGGPQPDMDAEEFDFKGTDRNQYMNAMFNHVCSEVLKGLLYLGSDNVARDYDKLKENGITHVINCAAGYSPDYHKDNGITYLSYHLKDHVRENIECCFYECIEFIEEARKQGGRVFVHCV